jgi:KTSC domain
VTRNAPEIEVIGSILTWLLILIPTIEIRPEVVDVESRGSVTLTDNFDCRDIKRSSMIQRVCYQEKERYLIVNIKGTYHQYCDVPVSTYVAFMGAFSMGHYFRKEIESGSNSVRYECELF